MGSCRCHALKPTVARCGNAELAVAVKRLCGFANDPVSPGPLPKTGNTRVMRRGFFSMQAETRRDAHMQAHGAPVASAVLRVANG